MEAKVRERLAELEAEFKKGQEEFQALANQLQAYAGALEVLRGLLAGDKPAEQGVALG